ncbi:MAG: oligopeptide:H+ symporter [Pseudomonadota bacterium]
MSQATFFGHPRGLAVLFFAEMWERFSFYGMRGLLILYLTKHWLFSDGVAAGIYASYAALVYLMPVIGGLLADRYLGFRKAVTIGAVLLCLGHLGMAFEGEPAAVVQGVVQQDTLALQVFYLSLGLIIVGVGLLKPNISSIVGSLYAADDPRRDAGFTLFYMGINVGAVVASLTCGYIGEVYGWAYGFGLAGVGMLVGLVTFVRGRGLLEGHGEPPDEARLAARRFGLSLQTRIVFGALVMVGVAWWLMQNQAVVGALLSWASLAAVAGILIYMFVACDAGQRRSMGLLLFLTAYSVIFWALFEQAGSSMNLFADRNVDREILGFQVATAQLQFFNPGFIILLAPLFSMLWQGLGRAGREPSTAAKFGLGVTQAGLGFLILVYGISLADETGQVAMIWLALAYLVHTTGELCLSPVGLSMVTRLAVSQVVGLMMGVWFLASSVAHYVAGLIAAVASVDGGGEASARDSLLVYQDTFYTVGMVGLVLGLVLLLIAPLLTRWVFSPESASSGSSPERSTS